MALSGNPVSGKEHYDRALAIYDPVEHGQLTTRSGRDIGVALLRLVPGACGCLVIQQLRAMTPSEPSGTPAKPPKPLH